MQESCDSGVTSASCRYTRGRMWLARRPARLPLLPSLLAPASTPLPFRSLAQLAVTLPCFSQKEEDYVRAQVLMVLF